MCVKEWRTPLSDIPEDRSGDWSIVKSISSKGSGDWMESMGFDYWEVFDKPITITVLSQKVEREDYNPEIDPLEYRYKPKTWMSDAPGEYFGMMDLVNRIRPKYQDGELVKQNVLVGGLGLGLIVFLLKLRVDIDRVFVIEIEKDVLQMVFPYIRKFYHAPEVLITLGDFLVDLPKLKEKRFNVDVIIADIWQTNNAEGKRLFRKTKDIMEENYPNAQHLYWAFQSSIEKCKYL
jgi:hypothetical protein